MCPDETFSVICQDQIVLRQPASSMAAQFGLRLLYSIKNIHCTKKSNQVQKRFCGLKCFLKYAAIRGILLIPIQMNKGNPSQVVSVEIAPSHAMPLFFMFISNSSEALSHPSYKSLHVLAEIRTPAEPLC